MNNYVNDNKCQNCIISDYVHHVCQGHTVSDFLPRWLVKHILVWQSVSIYPGELSSFKSVRIIQSVSVFPGDLSSISGSDDTSTTSSDDDAPTVKPSPIPSRHRMSYAQCSTDNTDSETEDDMSVIASTRRHPKVFLRNNSGQLIALYRCILNHKKVIFMYLFTSRVNIDASHPAMSTELQVLSPHYSVCVCLCMHMCVCVCVCVHVWYIQGIKSKLFVSE